MARKQIQGEESMAANTSVFVDVMSDPIQARGDGWAEMGRPWDDSGRNAALLLGQIASGLSGATVHAAAKKDVPALAADMGHAFRPRRPSGRFCLLKPRSLGTRKNSENVAGTKGFVS
jgi:hypothetical protein